jgi:hypothetical protein
MSRCIKEEIHIKKNKRQDFNYAQTYSAIHMCMINIFPEK